MLRQEIPRGTYERIAQLGAQQATLRQALEQVQGQLDATVDTVKELGALPDFTMRGCEQLEGPDGPCFLIYEPALGPAAGDLPAKE